MSCLDPVQLPCANLQRHRELSGHPAVCSVGAPSEPKRAEVGAAEEQRLLHQPLLSFNVSFCLCSACFPPLRCRSLPTPAVVTVTPVQHTAPPTCRCSLLVPELRSLPFSCHLPLPTLGCPSCHQPPCFPPCLLPCSRVLPRRRFPSPLVPGPALQALMDPGDKLLRVSPLMQGGSSQLPALLCWWW